MTVRCSVGIAAYNDEANIGKLLAVLLAQELCSVEITEIIVVASGCTDRTVPIAEGYAAQDPRIRVIARLSLVRTTSIQAAWKLAATSAICWGDRSAAVRSLPLWPRT